MEPADLIKLYEEANGKKASDDVIEFFKEGVEIPLIYKDGKIQVPKQNTEERS